MIDALQMILVEPDIRRLGWGIVTFVGFLQVRCRRVERVAPKLLNNPKSINITNDNDCMNKSGADFEKSAKGY